MQGNTPSSCTNSQLCSTRCCAQLNKRPYFFCWSNAWPPPFRPTPREMAAGSGTRCSTAQRLVVQHRMASVTARKCACPQHCRNMSKPQAQQVAAGRGQLHLAAQHPG